MNIFLKLKSKKVGGDISFGLEMHIFSSLLEI